MVIFGKKNHHIVVERGQFDNFFEQLDTILYMEYADKN